MSFAFAQPEVEAETAADRLAWEQRILGQTVSVHPLELVREKLGKVLPLHRLPKTRGRSVVVAGVRLPGWTGSQGFFFSDGDTYITVRGDKTLKAPKPWQVVVINGRWVEDKWGTGWLEAGTLQK
jgi:hypothetical protein